MRVIAKTRNVRIKSAHDAYERKVVEILYNMNRMTEKQVIVKVIENSDTNDTSRTLKVIRLPDAK